MLKVATATPNEPYREYKDVERVYSGSTEIDKILDKNGNVLFAVNKEVEGTPALTYKGKEETNLKNYRIYGQTVDGESVGDKTENLFDFGEWSKNINANSDNSLAKGIDGITITANSNDAFTAPYAYAHEGVYKIYVKPNTNYLLSWVSNNNLYGRVFVFKNGAVDRSHMINVNNAEKKYLLFGTDADTEFITLRFGVEAAGNTITYSKIMLIEGSTALPYEPYGYKVPVTVTNGTDTQTTNLYLPEQIKMVGDEAEYIDYAEQKQYRVRKNLLQNTATSQTRNGITFTVNADKSITCNGTTTNTIYFAVKDNVVLESGTYVLTGCPLDGGQNTFKLYAQTSGGAIFYVDEGAGAIINYKSKITILITILSGYTCNNLTFYPMIRKADIEDNTYEPYIENTDLDVTLPALPVLPGTNTLSVGTEVQPSNIHLKGRIKEIM